MNEVIIECDDESPLADGPWLVQPMLDSVHVVFEAEARLHEMDRGCWCGPDVELVDPVLETPHARPLVTHRHSMRDAS